MLRIIKISRITLTRRWYSIVYGFDIRLKIRWRRCFRHVMRRSSKNWWFGCCRTTQKGRTMQWTMCWLNWSSPGCSCFRCARSSRTRTTTSQWKCKMQQGGVSRNINEGLRNDPSFCEKAYVSFLHWLETIKQWSWTLSTTYVVKYATCALGFSHGFRVRMDDEEVHDRFRPRQCCRRCTKSFGRWGG